MTFPVYMCALENSINCSNPVYPSSTGFEQLINFVSSNWFPAKSVEQMIVEQSNFEQLTPTPWFVSTKSWFVSTKSWFVLTGSQFHLTWPSLNWKSLDKINLDRESLKVIQDNKENLHTFKTRNLDLDLDWSRLSRRPRLEKFMFLIIRNIFGKHLNFIVWKVTLEVQ